MKKLLTIIMLHIAAFSVTAQQKAEIIASYDVRSVDYETDSVTSTLMTLLANAGQSKYFNDISLWNDSLSSTPEGKKQLQQILMAACMTQTPDGGISIDMRKGPVKKVSTYVFTNLADNTLRYFASFANNPCYYDEPLDEMQWEIVDSTSTILGYDCIVAKTEYHGRNWIAWFTPEIPLPFGPWKLHGLPGLILKAVADNGTEYIATGIENTNRIISPMYSADDYQKVDRKKALAEHEYYLDNREAIIKAQHGSSIKFEYHPASRPKFNASKYASEPDYKSE